MEEMLAIVRDKLIEPSPNEVAELLFKLGFSPTSEEVVWLSDNA